MEKSDIGFHVYERMHLVKQVAMFQMQQSNIWRKGNDFQ